MANLLKILGSNAFLNSWYSAPIIEVTFDLYRRIPLAFSHEPNCSSWVLQLGMLPAVLGSERFQLIFVQSTKTPKIIAFENLMVTDIRA
jgi:hypothetical protein